MRRLLVSIVLLGSVPNVCLADEAENQATSFANIYISLCMKHLSNLEGLKAKLKDMPKLPPEKAAHFLGGNPGDVWPIADKHGIFF
jgi:hypothetical protein